MIVWGEVIVTAVLRLTIVVKSLESGTSGAVVAGLRGALRWLCGLARGLAGSKSRIARGTTTTHFGWSNEHGNREGYLFLFMPLICLSMVLGSLI